MSSCVYMHMCVCVCVLAHADKKLALNIFLSHFCFGFSRQGLSLTLEFTDVTRCSQHSPVSTSLALELHVHTVCTQLFYLGMWGSNSGLHACMENALLVKPAISLDPLLPFSMWENQDWTGHVGSNSYCRVTLALRDVLNLCRPDLL